VVTLPLSVKDTKTLVFSSKATTGSGFVVGLLFMSPPFLMAFIPYP
jgi:hypothetical protein